MAEMGHCTFPILPTFMVSCILSHKFENTRKIAEVKCPILIGHSRGDRMIPYWMSDRLADSAKAPVERLTIEKADHCDFFNSGENVMPIIGEFFARIAQ
jgi:fermentation-respiration switch protein FrsA (DUF1100 family)